MLRLHLKKIAAAACAVLVIICSIVYMVYCGILIPNQIFIGKDDMIGCDVSRYQGEIQWDILSQQGISFAFIKATEGSSHVDVNFAANWEQAFQTDLYVGAYHFFSFESPGVNQANHFFQVTGKKEGMLLPVVDVEFYGGYHADNTNSDQIRSELDDFIQIIEEVYGVKPIIYTTKEAYDHFLDGYYEDCPLWIRSILTLPRINRQWTFWQYTNRERLEGYAGDETYIDMNVFFCDREMMEGLVLTFDGEE